MALYDALTRQGYPFRQHLIEAGWTVRKLTVVDLTDAQQEALNSGGVEELEGALAVDGLWSFPSTQIAAALPRQNAVLLAAGGTPQAVVVAPPEGTARALADRFVAQIEERFDLRLDIVDADTCDHTVLATQDVVLFGGSHENRCAMKMALRYQTLFVDAAVPGDGGWVVATLTGLDPSGHTVVQVSAADDEADAAFGALMNSVRVDGTRLISTSVHALKMGPLMAEHWKPWEQLTRAIPGRIAQLQGQEYAIPTDPKRFSELVAIGLDSGGPDVNHYNVAPLDLSVRCAQYYLRSGDRRALELFRQLLFRAADYYLLTTEGASYPADLDFRLGHMILYFAIEFEHDPLFADDDRLILASLLLACTRSIHEYTLAFWPVEWNGRTRHNHETFPGRSLLYAADYFERYGLHERVAEFRDQAARIFSGGMWERFKQQENAGHYETYAFQHGINYSAFLGKGFDLFQADVLRMGALRSMLVTDNFFRTVDYGDSNVSMSPAGSDELTTLVSCGAEDPVLDWFGDQVFQRAPAHLPASPNGGIPGIRRGSRAGQPAPSGDWEFLPLDPRFMEDYARDFPPAYAFDKLAFRTGWQEEDHYLLFEGVGNKNISHAHVELNAIVRLNHLGRHWLVSNGYGRRAKLSNVAESFSSRIRGPEDHNMLVLRRDGEIVDDFPVCSAMLQRGRQSHLLHATGAVLDVGGLDWYRTLVVQAGRFVVIIDRLAPGPDAVTEGHVEWQGLGLATHTERGCRLTQEGISFDILSASGWRSEAAVADQSASWQGVLDSGAYPYAAFPLPKLLYHAPLQDGSKCRLVTLLAATRRQAPAFDITEDEDGVIRVTGDLGLQQPITMSDQDLQIQADGVSMEIRCQDTPQLPAQLRTLAAASG